MDVSVKSKKDNKLLRRAEVRFEVDFEGATPSRKQVKEKLCAALNARPELTLVDELRQGFGERVLYGYAKVYSAPEDMAAELPHIGLRDRGEKKVKAAKGKAKPAPKK